jgi:hypothetical protein
VTKERDVNAPGGGHNLLNHWVRGPGAAEIGWGTEGSMKRCIAKLSDKGVRDPGGLCAEYHHAATGEWPRGGTVPSAGDNEEFGVTDSHGHLHGKDGKFIDKPGGGSLDKLKSVGRSNADDDLGPTHADNVRRAAELEDKADSDEGLDALEARELKRLRQLLSGERDREDDDDEDGTVGNRTDYALTAAAKKRKKDTDDDMDSYATGVGDEPWNGVLTVEGLESGDGRLFALGSLDWEQPPQPLMYQPANVGGHNGSVMVGNITKMTRHGSRIRGEGTVFGSALKSEHGENIRHMMANGGVSVDVDRVKDADVEMVYADDESGEGGMFAKPETTIFHRGRIRGATLVAFPAFVEAKLAFTNQTLTAACDTDACGCETDDPLIASVHTITIPNLPKAEWFNEPTDVKLSGALTITDDGRVYGILAPGNTTHRSVKRRVPRGNVDYTRFHKAETIVEGGSRVVTGVITAACGHAPTENYGTLERRRDHYDNSCSVLANIRIGESKQGHVYAAGALNPGADPRQVAQALGCALSGDWQPHPDRPGVQEFIAAHLVPVPGFPMARSQASVVYQDGLITASVIPVEHVKTPRYVTGPTYDDTFNAIQMAKRTLVASLGLDPATRKREVMRELELI